MWHYLCKDGGGGIVGDNSKEGGNNSVWRTVAVASAVKIAWTVAVTVGCNVTSTAPVIWPVVRAVIKPVGSAR